jgi:hypothetical protein
MEAIGMRRAPEHAHAAARRQQDAREHLDHGRLARTIRAQVAHRFPRLDLKGDAAHGVDLRELAGEQTAQRAPQPRKAPRLAKAFGDGRRLDDRLGKVSRTRLLWSFCHAAPSRRACHSAHANTTGSPRSSW